MINYRLATSDDNQQLIDLTAATGMDGDIALRIDRTPDFFRLLNMRGDSKVFLALDDNNIVGSLCVSRQHVHIGGRIFPIYYVADFKVLENYRNQSIGAHLTNQLASYLISIEADLVFLTVAKGNKKPISFFKNRPNIADFESIGNFSVYQLIGKKSKQLRPQYEIEETLPADDVIMFLDRHYQKYALGSVITSEKLEGVSIYKICEGTKIIAAMCLVDTMEAKQNVVTKMSTATKYALRSINYASSLFGLSKMPSLNEPVRMMYVKYIAVTDHKEELVNVLIDHARNIVHKRSYSFLSIGLHEKDPLNKCLTGMFKLTFSSVGMLLSLKNNNEIIERVKEGIPYEDYSLV